MDDSNRRDDHLPATRGELRSLTRRIERLENLPRDFSDLRAEFIGLGAGIENHIRRAVPVAVRAAIESYSDKFDKLDKVLEILVEQEVRARLRAEEKAAEEVRQTHLAALREHRLKRLAVIGPIVIALIGAFSATVVSQCSAMRPPVSVSK